MCEFIANTLQHMYLSRPSKAFFPEPQSSKYQVEFQSPSSKTTARERVAVALAFYSFQKTPGLLLTSGAVFPFPSAWQLLRQRFGWLASHLVVLSFVSPLQRGAP